MTRFAFASLFTLALFLPLGGCAPQRGPDFERALAEGRRAESAGRFSEAAEKYDIAMQKAKLPRDKARMAYETATLLAKGGNVAEAVKRFDALAQEKPQSAYAPNAALRAAELRIAHGNEAEGVSGLERVVLDFPNSGSAVAALLHLVRKKDDAAEATATYLLTLAPKVTGTEIEERVLYERAKHLEASDPRASRAIYLDLAARFPYPRGVHFDDALFHAAEIDERAGAYKDAIGHLERLLAERESSHMMGSYERPRYSTSAMKIAEIYATRLNDKAAAKSAYHRVYTDFVTSPFRDDALFKEAALYAAENDRNGECSTLSTLVSHFDDSRFVPCAEAKCPSVKRSDKSKAPKTCHAYLERAP